MGIEGPKGNVIIVFGDNSKGIFYYISPEDTAENGYTPDVEIGTPIVNETDKVLVETDTKLIAEIVKNVTSDSFVITLRKGISEIGLKSEDLINSEIKLIPETEKDNAYDIANAKIAEVLDDKNILVKLGNGFSFQNGKTYIVQSNQYIYFGSIKFEYTEIVPEYMFISEITEEKNGSFVIKMNKDITDVDIKIEEFEITQNIDGIIEKVSNPVIKNKFGQDIIIAMNEVEQGIKDKSLFYKISYKNIQKLISGTVIIKGKPIMSAEVKLELGTISSFKNITIDTVENIRGTYKFKTDISNAEAKLGSNLTIMTNNSNIKLYILNESNMIVAVSEINVSKSNVIKTYFEEPNVKADVSVEIGNVSSFKNIKIDNIYNLEETVYFGTSVYEGEVEIGEVLTIMTNENEIKIYVKNKENIVIAEAFLNVNKTGKTTINLLPLSM